MSTQTHGEVQLPNTAKQVHDFEARSPDELTLKKGEEVEVLERDGMHTYAVLFYVAAVDRKIRKRSVDHIVTEEFNDGWYLVSFGI